MNRNTIRKAGTVLLCGLWLALSVTAWFHRPVEISTSERRKLAQLPPFQKSSFLNGSFSSAFENYAVDQFPAREAFREIKSHFQRNILGQMDNNGVYIQNGFAAKIEYPLNTASVEHAIGRFQKIYRDNLENTDCRMFFALVPDKGYYLAPTGGYPRLDYTAMTHAIAEALPTFDMISLFGTLDIDDYYRTDAHWRQECLLPAADAICKEIGIPPASHQSYGKVPWDVPFYGVYRGQGALSMAPDQIITMENSLLDACRVYNYETNQYTTIYDSSKKSSLDPYDIYLSGASALLRIENPLSQNDRHLILFRDSFGSSIAPLLVHGYKTVTLVDIRYISSGILDHFLTFSNQDVLFLYSTTVLNNSSAMK